MPELMQQQPQEIQQMPSPPEGTEVGLEPEAQGKDAVDAKLQMLVDQIPPERLMQLAQKGETAIMQQLMEAFMVGDPENGMEPMPEQDALQIAQSMTELIMKKAQVDNNMTLGEMSPEGKEDPDAPMASPSFQPQPGMVGGM